MALTPMQGLDLEALEGIVDRCGLSGVIEMLEAICEEKAEHLRHNWQDSNAALLWERDADKLSRFLPKLEH